MRIIATASCCLVLAACSSSTSLGTQTESTLRAAGGGGAGGLTIRASDGAQVNQLPYPIARVWAVLPAVYDSLGLTLSEVDPSTHVIGSSIKAHKNLGTVSLGKIIDCGNAQGFPSAEAYDIRLTIRSQVEAQADGTTNIGTMLEAAGRPMQVAGDFVRCTTKLMLEKQIYASVKARLGS